MLHLLYSRYLTMALKELGHLDFEEPFARFRAHGHIVKDGAKMSKTKGNIVVPDDYIAKWGADTFRTYLMFLGPLQDGGDFRDEGVAGPRRFLERMWLLVGNASDTPVPPELVAKWHQAKHRATEGMESLRYNTAIAALMELLNTLKDAGTAPRPVVEEMILMLAPFAPHFAEECWERLGYTTSIFEAAWPAYDPALAVESTIEIVIQVNGKTRSKVAVARDADEATVIGAALADEATQKVLEGKPLKKKIYVPGRLVNLVV